MTDGDVGLYDKKLSATRSLGVFDWPCNSERVKILPWSHDFLNFIFHLAKQLPILSITETQRLRNMFINGSYMLEIAHFLKYRLKTKRNIWPCEGVMKGIRSKVLMF